MANTITQCSTPECEGVVKYTSKQQCNRCYKREQYHASKTPERLSKRAATTAAGRERMKEAGTYKAAVRKNNLWVNFKMTPEEYDAMLADQNGRCAICDRHQSEFSKRFAVDHDHACCETLPACGECNRGLLCISCNNGIGRFDDNVERLMSAAAYLIEWGDNA